MSLYETSEDMYFDSKVRGFIEDAVFDAINKTSLSFDLRMVAESVYEKYNDDLMDPEELIYALVNLCQKIHSGELEER